MQGIPQQRPEGQGCPQPGVGGRLKASLGRGRRTCHGLPAASGRLPCKEPGVAGKAGAVPGQEL